MKLSLIVNGAERTFEILTPAPACRFRLDDRERSAQVETVEPGVYSVLMDGRSYEARVEHGPGALGVVIDGYRFEIEVRDPRRWSRKGAGLGAEGVQSIVAPMPGKVVRVLVAAGDAVEAGQGLVVVEAMKMQNELKSPKKGVVLKVLAEEGAAVNAGDVLAIVE